jgi:predicted dehydrogenase
VTLVGVCDLDEARARANAARFRGEAVFTDAAAMLASTRPDGLVVCAGARAHVALALLALERGIPVYTEKPAAVSAAEAWRVAEASRTSGKLAMTGYKYRYGKAMVKAKAIMATPEFGRVSLVGITRTTGPMGNDPGNPASQFLLDFCSHSIDAICHLGGEVAQVFASAPTAANYAVALTFSSGAVGSLTLSSHGSWNRPTDHTDVLGEAGRAITIDDQIFLRYHVDGVPRSGHEPRFCTSGADSLEETGFLPELRAFVEHLRGERSIADIPSRIEQSLHSTAVYDAIMSSAASGRPERPERFGAAAGAAAGKA